MTRGRRGNNQRNPDQAPRAQESARAPREDSDEFLGFASDADLKRAIEGERPSENKSGELLGKGHNSDKFRDLSEAVHWVGIGLMEDGKHPGFLDRQNRRPVFEGWRDTIENILTELSLTGELDKARGLLMRSRLNPAERNLVMAEVIEPAIKRLRGEPSFDFESLSTDEAVDLATSPENKRLWAKIGDEVLPVRFISKNSSGGYFPIGLSEDILSDSEGRRIEGLSKKDYLVEDRSSKFLRAGRESGAYKALATLEKREQRYLRDAAREALSSSPDRELFLKLKGLLEDAEKERQLLIESLILTHEAASAIDWLKEDRISEKAAQDWADDFGITIDEASGWDMSDPSFPDNFGYQPISIYEFMERVGKSKASLKPR